MKIFSNFFVSALVILELQLPIPCASLKLYQGTFLASITDGIDATLFPQVELLTKSEAGSHHITSHHTIHILVPKPQTIIGSQPLKLPLSGGNKAIFLECRAQFPIEWIVSGYRAIAPNANKIDTHPKITKRNWMVTTSRTENDLWNSSTYVYRSILSLYDPLQSSASSSYQHLCVEVDDIYSTRILGAALSLTESDGKVWLHTNATEFYKVHFYDPSGPSEHTCNITMEFHTDTKQMCCLADVPLGAQDVELMREDCFDSSECKNLHKMDGCVRVANSSKTITSYNSRLCANTSDLVAAGSSSGVLSCGVTSQLAPVVTFRYFMSVLDTCDSSTTGSNGRGSTMYVNEGYDPWAPRGSDEVDEGKLLHFCPFRPSRVYVGETVELRCLGSYYYFSAGFHFIIKRNVSGSVIESRTGAVESNIAGGANFTGNITRQLVSRSKLGIQDTNIFEVVCIAPPRNRPDWVNSTQRLSVVVPKVAEFEGGDGEQVKIYTWDGNTTVRCRAQGDPDPVLSWHNLPRNVDVISDNQIAEIALIVFERLDNNGSQRAQELQEFFSCLAAQDRISSRRTKIFHIKYSALTAQDVVISLSTPAVFVVGAGTLGVLLVGLGVFCVLVRKFRDRWRNLNPVEVDEFFNGKSVAVAGSNLNADPSSTESNPTLETNAWNLKYDTAYELRSKDLQISSQLIGKGEFSKVYLGSLTKSNEKVAVKTNVPYLSTIDFKAVLYEVKLHIFLGEHAHIVKFLGAKTSRVKQRQVFLALELCEFGDLGSYLRTNRMELLAKVCLGPGIVPYKVEGAKTICLVPRYVSQAYLIIGNVAARGNQLIRWTHQILDALIFLAEERVVHGDLAARNVLLDSALTAKICDFGMAHQVTREHYAYMVSPHTRKPWDSAAPDCLERCEYSIKSDVYAFGVLLWELFTLGDTPWADMNVSCMELLEQLKAGRCLPMPVVATTHDTVLISTPLYEKMKECWRLEPISRPTAQDLKTFFSTL